MALCSMCRKRPARDRQRSCHACHAQAQKRYRERQKRKLNETEAALESLLQAFPGAKVFTY